MKSYESFLKSKLLVTSTSGVECEDALLPSGVFAFQSDLIKWSLRKGRAAVFADTGLGKTIIQLCWAQQAASKSLILAPLAVAKQTVEEGRRWGIDVTYARKQSDAPETGIAITNYEMLNSFAPEDFGAVVLDESSILKNFEGKTRKRLIEAFVNTPLKLCCTATPAPNDITEIANHAEFLGLMSRAEMLARFFVHDDSGWRLKGHAREPFYRWLASWSMSIKQPSDLGYSDDGFNLPPLKIEANFIDTDYKPAGQLFPSRLKGITERVSVRKATMVDRVRCAVETISREPNEQWLVWCGTNDESKMLTSMLPDAIEVKGSDSIEHKERALLGFVKGEIGTIISKPSICGFGMNFQKCARMIFVGLGDSYEQYYQAIRRCYRFGQKREVKAYIVLSETEYPIYANVMDKEHRAAETSQELLKHVERYERAELKHLSEAKFAYQEESVSGNGWKLMLGDSAERLKDVASGSVDLSVFSPPFATLYTYSNTERDLGNCKNYDEFWRHFAFISAELRRVMKPGRNVCVHVQQLATQKARDGFIGMIDFRGDIIRHFQSAGFIYHGEICIDKDPQCLRNGTPVLTPTGWNAIDGLKVGDFVFGSDGKPTEVVGVWPKDKRMMYRVTFSDGVSIECDGNHLWPVRTAGSQYRESGHWKVMRTDEIVGNTLSPSGKPRYEALIVAPVEHPVRRLPIDPYLLGALIGNGNYSQRSTVAIEAGYDHVGMLSLPEGAFVHELPNSRWNNGKGASFHIQHPEWHVNPVLDGLRELDIHGHRSWEKHIPAEYLTADTNARLELLRGLMDTDGTCKKNGSAFYSTVSLQLATDIVALVRSLGGLTTTRIEHPTFKYNGKLKNGRPRYLITVMMEQNPFKLERKASRWHHTRALRRWIVSIEPSVEDYCTCITVAAENGLFVTDHYVVTHNSQAIRTHSKSLLFVQLRKDASWLRPAFADYIVIFRAPGENEVPVLPDIQNNEWIEWARPIWYGIKESDTLNVVEARSQEDERHICLARGSLVLTREHGYVPIESISIGERVLTHEGRWQPVIGKACNGVRDVIEVGAQGVACLTVTPDHRLWTRLASGDKAKRGALANTPRWIPANETIGSYLNLKLPPVENNSLTNDEWWIVGRYLGDGHRGGHKRSGKRNSFDQFFVSCAHGEAPGLISRLGVHAGHITKRTATQIALKNLRKPVRDVLNRCGRGAAGKKLPGEAVALSAEKAESLLDGYLSSDGHYVGKHDRWTASSISRALLLGMALVAQRARGVVASVYAGMPEREGVIAGRDVAMSQDWIFAFRNSDGYRKSAWISTDGAWKKVRKLQDAGRSEVWDIAVDEDGSFTAEGAIVKNCPLQLGTIERCVKLWSNKGETILSPFAGIGSEGYQAILSDRRFIGIELKPEYFAVAIRNLKRAEKKKNTITLFDNIEDDIEV